MTLGDILNGIKNLGTKAAGTIGNLLSSANTNAVQPAVKTMSDYFAPSPNGVRVRDVLREVPGATAGVAKDIARGAATFALSAGEAIPEIPLEGVALATGKPSPIKPYEPTTIPGIGFLGPLESYQNKAKKAVTAGESPVGAILKGAGSAVLDEPTGIAAKPLLVAGKAFAPVLAGFIKGGGGKEVEAMIQALVGSKTAEEATQILTKAGMDTEKAAGIAPKLAQATSEGDVRGILASGAKGTAVKPVASQGADMTLYHTTTPKAEKAIQAGGFKTVPPEDQIGQAFGQGSYFSTTPEEAQAWKQFVTNDGKGKIVTVKGKFNIYDPKVASPADYWDKLAKKAGVKSTPEMGQEIADAYLMRGYEAMGSTENIMSREAYDAAMTRSQKIIEGLKAKGIDGAKFVEPDMGSDITNPQVVIFNIEKLNSAMKAGAVTQTAKETPKGVQGAKSVGELLAERGTGGAKPPRVPRETTGPIPSGTPPERRFITRTKEMAPEAAPLLKGQYARRDTAALIAQADARIAKDPAGAVTFAKTDTTDEGVATASRLLDNFIGQAKVATDEATKNELYAKAAEVANDAAKNLTEHGRAVQAATILGKLTPEGMVRWAAGEIQRYNESAGARTVRNFLGGAKKIPELTAEQTKRITTEMQRIANMTDIEAKAQAFSALQKEIKTYVPSSLYSKIIALWKAGLLTGIKTTGLNIISNASHAVSEVAKDVPASLVDRIASLFTGKRTLALTGKGIAGGTKEGISKGWRFLRTGYDERDALGKLDYHQVNFGKGPIAKTLQKYEETVFGLLGAEDQPFYYGAKARSLYSQAIATAMNEGLKGPAIAARVNELVANPTDDMLKYAVMDAQTAVFQNKTALGKVASSLQKAPGGEIILPFGRTPAAVATQIINYSPAGIVKTIIENIGKGRFDQRLFSQGIGRGLTGTGVLAIGAALYSNKLMTTTRPTSEGEQKLWQLEGKGPNMVNINGTWRNINVLGPLGMVLAVGANMEQGIKETGTFIGGLGAAAAGAGSALTQQTFLYGINQAINALNDPSRYGAQFINNLVGSVIPTIIADVARATDPLERRTTTAGERLTSRIPGLREFLQPQVDTFGTKIPTPNFFTVMADPTRPGNATADANDPVVLELRRLSDAGFPATPTMLGGTTGYKSLTEKQNNQLWEIAGKFAKQKVAETMQNPRYQKWDDEEKAKKIASAVDDSKTEARARVIYYATKGLEGAQLNSALSTFKADKLLTKQVYTRYKEIIRFGK